MVSISTAGKSDLILLPREIDPTHPTVEAGSLEDKAARAGSEEAETMATRLSISAKTIGTPRREPSLGSRARRWCFDTHIVYLLELRKV